MKNLRYILRNLPSHMSIDRVKMYAEMIKGILFEDITHTFYFVVLFHL